LASSSEDKGVYIAALAALAAVATVVVEIIIHNFDIKREIRQNARILYYDIDSVISYLKKYSVALPQNTYPNIRYNEDWEHNLLAVKKLSVSDTKTIFSLYDAIYDYNSTFNKSKCLNLNNVCREEIFSILSDTFVETTMKQIMLIGGITEISKFTTSIF